MKDIVERIENRIHDAPMPTEHLLDECGVEIERLRTVMACLSQRRSQLRDERDKLRAELQLIRCTVNGAIKRCGIEDPK
jgi:FtsZ-binding cell division protein ZapB